MQPEGQSDDDAAAAEAADEKKKIVWFLLRVIKIETAVILSL